MLFVSAALALPAEKVVWRQVRDRVAFYGSVHATARTIQIRIAWDPSSAASYARWLGREDSSHRDAGSGSVPLNVAAIAAGLLVTEFTRFRCGRVSRPLIGLNLATRVSTLRWGP